MLESRGFRLSAKSAVLGYRARELAPLVPCAPGMKSGTTAGNRNTFLSDQSDKLSISETCGVLLVVYPRGEFDPITVGS
jgi:hypothetical protein